jgi:hypothetical protein
MNRSPGKSGRVDVAQQFRPDRSVSLRSIGLEMSQANS